MNCAMCSHNDGLVYTSLPVKYRCQITGEYNEGGHQCDVKFVPIKEVGNNTIAIPVPKEMGESTKRIILEHDGIWAKEFYEDA